MWPQPGEGEQVDNLYQLAVNDLKNSGVKKTCYGTAVAFYNEVSKFCILYKYCTFGYFFYWGSEYCRNRNLYAVYLQRWARAFQDNCYHAAVDTNNGTEAQNKLFKYTFLPRKKQKATLSNTVSIIVENYLPSVKYKFFYKTISNHLNIVRITVAYQRTFLIALDKLYYIALIEEPAVPNSSQNLYTL